MTVEVLNQLIKVEVLGLRRRAAECRVLAHEPGCSSIDRSHLLGQSYAYDHAADIIEKTSGGES